MCLPDTYVDNKEVKMYFWYCEYCDIKTKTYSKTYIPVCPCCHVKMLENVPKDVDVIEESDDES